MGVGDFLHSNKGKKIVGFCYSFFSAVVLLGALFKLQHWPGGAMMLTIGMGAEVFLFLLGVFDKPVDIPDWKRVFPELGSEEDRLIEEQAGIVRHNFYDQFNKIASGAVPSNGGGSSVSSLPGVSEDVLKNLEKSLTNLSNTANNFADISNATVATKDYLNNMKSASSAMDKFAQANETASDNMQKSVGAVLESYKGASTVLENTHKALGTAIEKESAQFGTNMSKVNQQLSALNSSYEAQLTSANQYATVANSMTGKMGEMESVFAGSVEEAKKYQSQAQQLNNNISALNSVYGNMLGAMNVNIK
ncbi:gliding motility protein GldL [Halosquirtibacter laminarini]|uniref:Gliding motility protein GldL n=1 Tax=Halosquirtibacter laminarini TaxID=3374600 RepID=A0AC61NEU1_9BACT|nr:gliding motility protein GldL [Prolixibacteraceae bacterium]